MQCFPFKKDPTKRLPRKTLDESLQHKGRRGFGSSALKTVTSLLEWLLLCYSGSDILAHFEEERSGDIFMLHFQRPLLQNAKFLALASQGTRLNLLFIFSHTCTYFGHCIRLLIGVKFSRT